MATATVFSPEIEAELAALKYVDPFPGRDGSEVAEQRVCWKCGGSGHIAHYNYYAAGQCFECLGTGGRHDMTVDALRKEKRNQLTSRRRKIREGARKEIAFNERLQAAIAVRPEWAKVRSTDSSFVHELWMKCWKYDLTDKQIHAGADAIQRELDRNSQRAAAQKMDPLEEGRQQISGTVISVKQEQDDYSPYGGMAIKITVALASGHRVYGTCPSSLVKAMHDAGNTSDALRGKTVEFAAAIKRSNQNDFAIFSRPTKARIAELATA